MKNIRKIIRIGLPETNSSSSHALVINTGNFLIKRGDPDCNLGIVDNKLYVDSNSFNWEWVKYSDVSTKLEYACGFLDYNTGVGQKQVQRFKGLLKKYLGVDDVIFQWELKDNIGTWGIEPPEIDHQSRCLESEIFENNNTLINFIFNRYSWLITGNDNSEGPGESFYEGIYEPKKDYVSKEKEVATEFIDKAKFILSADLGSTFGIVETEPIKDLNDINNTIEDVFYVFGNFCYDISNKKFCLIEDSKSMKDNNRYRYFTGIAVDENGNFYLQYSIKKDGIYYIKPIQIDSKNLKKFENREFYFELTLTSKFV